MRILFWTAWALGVCSGAVNAAASKTSGVVEVDLVFPRNETYAPTSILPIVFGFQNSELAPFLGLQLSFTVWRWDNLSDFPVTSSYDLRWANFSSNDPYFEYRHFTKFDREGTWKLTWTVGWANCTEDSLAKQGKDRVEFHSSTTSTVFTTKNSAQEVDLSTATKNEDCSTDMGFAFNVTNTHKVPTGIEWAGGETCVAVAPSLPTPNPCQVKIDSAAAASMSASITERRCKGTDPPADCPSDESAAQKLLVGGVACLMAVVGALGYTMV
jgi:hypothetical protein